MKLTDKVAIITGAASGMGKAMATLFALEGARLVIADIDDKGSEQTVNEINSTNGKAIFVHTDVSKSSDVKNLIDATIDEFSKIDILVNNAGIFMKMTPIEEIDETVWDRIYSVNVKGIFHGTKYVVPVMKKSGGGIIINTASMTGQRPGSMQSAYASSKGAVIALTKALALELAPYGIRVNCICPILTDTPMMKEVPEERIKEIAGAIPLGRLAKPEDIAYAALYLASGESSMLTGVILNVDGGHGV